MGLVPYLVTVFAYGLILMTDIAILLLVVRLACGWRRVRVLQVFDAAGRPLVDYLTGRVATLWASLDGAKALSGRQTLALTLAALLLLRWLLAAIGVAWA